MFAVLVCLSPGAQEHGVETSMVTSRVSNEVEKHFPRVGSFSTYTGSFRRNLQFMQGFLLLKRLGVMKFCLCVLSEKCCTPGFPNMRKNP